MSSFRLLRGGRTLLLLGILAVAGTLLWWRFVRVPEVVAVAATRGTAAEIVYGTGAVEPVRWAKVASLIRQRIVDLCYCEGKAVAKGDVLARLDDKEARAQLTELRAREDFAKRELSRATELIGRGAATTQAFERISSDLRQVQGLISVQMEKLDAYTITAPIEGVVLRRDGEIGEIVEQGQILFRVGRTKAIACDCRSERGGHPACRCRSDRAFAHRRLPGPPAGGQGVRDHADGRCDRQDLSHPRLAARRYTAPYRHERGG